jgi:hypothetical protein
LRQPQANGKAAMSSFIPIPLTQENINSAVDWMTADDDFLAEVYLSTPTSRVQLKFGDTQKHGGVARLKALTKAIVTAKDHIKAVSLKQRFLFKLDHSGRGNRALANDLHEALTWADSRGLMTGAIVFNQVLSTNIAEGFVWFGVPDPKKAVQFQLASYDHTSI